MSCAPTQKATHRPHVSTSSSPKAAANRSFIGPRNTTSQSCRATAATSMRWQSRGWYFSGHVSAPSFAQSARCGNIRRPFRLIPDEIHGNANTADEETIPIAESSTMYVATFFARSLCWQFRGH